jgi:rare lipoprotein A
MYRVIMSALVFALLISLELAGANRARAQMASWYGFEGGSMTASGEHYNPGALTAASPSLPFGTLVRVTNRNNGRSVVVRINDRGPFTGGRSIDLSQAAAAEIGMIGSGVAPVSLEVVGGGHVAVAQNRQPSGATYMKVARSHSKSYVKVASNKTRTTVKVATVVTQVKTKPVVMAFIPTKHLSGKHGYKHVYPTTAESGESN